MGRWKVAAGQQGATGGKGAPSRRSRLDVSSFSAADDEQEREEPQDSDPIAAATRAKQERKEAELRAAAKAAAARVPANLKTWLEDMGPLTALSTDENKDPAENSSNAAAKNPLASLIGYTDEDSEDSVSPGHNPRSDDHGLEAVDDKVASFLDELESNGLLADGDSNKDIDVSDSAAKDVKSGAMDSGTGTQGPSESYGIALSNSSSSSEDVSTSAPEQKVLGTVEGAPSWSRVLDTASGSIYYWNQTTNEVLWDSPLGASAEPTASSKPAEDNFDIKSSDLNKQEMQPPDVALTSGEHITAFEQEQIAAAREAVESLIKQTSAWLDITPQPVRFAIEGQARLHMIDTLLQAGAQKAAVTMLVAGFDIAAIHQQTVAVAALGSPLSCSTEQGSKGVTSTAVSNAGHDGDVDMEADMDCDDSHPQSTIPMPPTEALPALSKASIYAAAASSVPLHTSNPASESFVYPGAGYHAGFHYASTDPSVSYAAYVPSHSYPFTYRVAPPLPDESPPLPPDTDPASPPQPPPHDSAPDEATTASLQQADTVASSTGELEAVVPTTRNSSIQSAAQHASELLESQLARGTQPLMAPPARGTDATTALASDSKASSTAAAEESAPATATEAKNSSTKSKKSRKLPKAATKLLDKWQALREAEREAQALKQAAESELFDAEALKRKRMREAEEWRLKQLATGGAVDNANFQPIAGDWREKVKQARMESSHSTKPQPSASTVGSDGKPDLDALSRGLPDGWRAMWDKGSGEVYYGNLKTRETSWSRPS